VTRKPETNPKETMQKKSEDCFNQSPYHSLKLSNYFQAYDKLFEAYRGKSITFVEVGVLSGGSLHMWRNYFGPEARIIGIDLNPAAKRWVSDGFEIFVGNQQSREFWREFYSSVGTIDVLLDDGGHTYAQQIVTIEEALDRMETGLIVLEDTCTSFMREFGFPSVNTFTEWSKRRIDSINARFEDVDITPDFYSKKIQSIQFFTSLIAFHVNERDCVASKTLENNGVRVESLDLRHGSGGLHSAQIVIDSLRSVSFLKAILSRSRASRFVITIVRRFFQNRDVRQTIKDYTKKRSKTSEFD
jgi:hypothetical protein